MTYYKDFCILNKADLPQDFIKLSELTIVIKNCQVDNDKQLYFSVDTNLQLDRDLSNVCIDKVNENGEITHFAYLYKHYPYMSPIKLMLEDSENINYYKLYITHEKLLNNKTSMNVTFYIKKLFMLDLYEKSDVPLIIYKLIRSLNTQLIHTNDIEIQSCKSFPTNDKNINILRNPFYYQKENFSWMANLEMQVDNNNLSFETFMYVKSPNISYHYINELKDYICLHVSENKQINLNGIKCKPIKFYGGILADNIGLGKTFSMICLIKYQYKPDSNSNLIICPKRLCLQWQTEINKSVNLTTFIIYNIAQFRKYCKHKNKYDIVITSYEFLNSAKYNEYCDNADLPNDRFKMETYEWERIILDEGHEYITSNNNLRKKQCREISYKLHTLKSKYRWICSGTPFSTKSDLWEVVRFLNKNKSEIFEKKYTTFDEKYAKNIKTMANMTSVRYTHATTELLNLICRQNTKKRVNSQIKIPTSKIYNVFLKMTNIEKAIYDSALDDIDKQYELCNHILVSDQHLNILGNKPLPLNEVHDKMVTYYQKTIIYQQTRLNNIKQQLNGLRELNEANESDKYMLEYNELHIKFLEIDLKFSENKRKLKIFENLEQKIKEEKNCPICFEDLSNIHNGVLDCGHFICCQCINKITKHNSKCPLCRKTIIKKTIKVISPESLKMESKLGTKINMLIKCCKYTIRTNDANRIIIFSRWSSMLRLLSKILNDHDITHLILNGAYHTINSKIRKFKLDASIRIILLSSEKAASGLNLTEANHIILLDTLNNDPDISKVIEEQAIGRAVRIGQTQNVKVIRFIMKETVEEEFYNKLNTKYIEKEDFQSTIKYVLAKKGMSNNIADIIFTYMN